VYLGNSDNTLSLRQLDQIYNENVERTISWLADMVDRLEDDHVLVRQALRRRLNEEPVQFIRASVELVRQGKLGPGEEFIGKLLSNSPQTLFFVANPLLCSLVDGIALSRIIAAADPGFDLKLVRHAREARWLDGSEDAFLIQVLELLSSFSDGLRIFPYLMHLLRHQDERIRSKATLLIGRARKDPRWVSNFLGEKDSRIRANAVECLIGQTNPDALKVLRLATRDSNHRVVANAWLGLYLAGETKAGQALMNLANSSEPADQAAAAWAMGRSGDSFFAGQLKTLSASTVPVVKRSALKALVSLRKLRPEPVP